MKTKNLLLGLFSVLTVATYAQSETNSQNELQAQVTELKIETENFEELKNFDWDPIKEMFQDNDKDQEISIAFAYVNKAETDNSKARLDNFSFEATGKTAELDDLIKRLGTALEKLTALEEKDKE